SSVKGEKNASWKPGFFHDPKGDREKMVHQETLWQSRLTRFNGCAWKTNCCGIFCNPQEGSESKSKVCRDLPPQERVPYIGYVQILFGVQKRILQLCKTDQSSGKGCFPCRNNSPTAKQMLSYLRLPADVAMAERK